MRRSVVAIETHKLTVIRPLREPITAWCEQCARSVAMATPETAARLTAITTREVYRRIEDGSLHFIETENGSLLVCCRNDLQP